MTQPGKWWFLSELAEYLGTSPSSLQRELSALVDSGILERRREGARAYFRAQSRSPIYRELRGIFKKTTGIVPTVRTALAAFDRKILCAFIYGSMAGAREHAASDIDLMIVGNVGLAELTPALRKAERVLGRELNVTNYSIDEFRAEAGNKNHFLVSVLKRPKQFVKGSERELDTITGK
jgi:DNA-binding transcriptional ArsR family regulator